MSDTDDNPRACNSRACIAARAQALAQLLRSGDVDAALDMGLMRFDVSAARGVDDPPLAAAVASIAAAQTRLTRAWAARERYRARTARLRERENVRAAKRSKAAIPGNATLPPAAAAALARAKARATGSP